MIARKERNDIIYIAVLSLCFLLAMILFSCYTSPLYPNYFGYDSAIFTLVGKGLLAGKELYTDLFDHKGPFIFFITAMGQMIGEKTGIFVMQCFSGLTTLWLLYYAVKETRSKRQYDSFLEIFTVFFSAYAVFFYTFQRGNLTEEYSLPFLAWALLLFVRYAMKAELEAAHPPIYAYIYGLCFSCVAFLRLNNAVTIAAGILGIAVFLIGRKEYANLVKNLLSGILGMLTVIVPVCVHFARCTSLEEMIYATFLHNFTIAGSTGHMPLSEMPYKFFVLYLPLVICLWLILKLVLIPEKRKFIDILLLWLNLANIAALWAANRFPHYFTIFFPLYVVVIGKENISKNKIKLSAITVCTGLNLIFALGYSMASIDDVYIRKEAAIRHETIQMDSAQIPENERNSVIGYKIQAADYLSADIIPCYKYYTLQDTWAITNPEIETDFMEWICAEKPHWILTLPEENNPELLEILQREYEFKFENTYIEYYRLKVT